MESSIAQLREFGINTSDKQHVENAPEAILGGWFSEKPEDILKFDRDRSRNRSALRVLLRPARASSGVLLRIVHKCLHESGGNKPFPLSGLAMEAGRNGVRAPVLLFSVILLLSASAAFAQEFEAAVVKPHASGVPCEESNTYPGGRLILSCFTLYGMIVQALDLQPGQSRELTGGPDWVRTELWDVAAKAAGEAGELKPETYRTMLLKLAEEQFHLKLGTRKQVVKGFELTIDHKSRARPGLVLNSGSPYRFDLEPGLTLTAQRLSIEEFAGWLKMPMAAGQRVEDKTGLRGKYDFVLKWTPSSIQRTDGATPLNDGPTIFTALKEQLGLRLQPGRVLADVYTIEAAQRPDW